MLPPFPGLVGAIPGKVGVLKIRLFEKGEIRHCAPRAGLNGLAPSPRAFSAMGPERNRPARAKALRRPIPSGLFDVGEQTGKRSARSN
jgi:hypothetical protein